MLSCDVMKSLWHCSGGVEPEYTLMREPVTGELPQFLVMEVQLPGIVSDSTVVYSHSSI